LATEPFTRQNKCFKPSDDLLDLMVGLHSLELERVKLEKDIAANRFTKEEATEKREILKKRKRYFDTMKVRVLDNVVFPSMANLTRFLELVLVSPYLNRAFERDLKALLLATSVTSENTQPIFARFIDACCWSKTGIAVSRRGKVKSNVPLSDFRFILMEIMMDKIWMMIPGLGEYKFKSSTFLSNVLYADFGRAVSWMKEFAHEPHGNLQFDEKRRPALF
jgi:hypothetical protein